MLIEKEKVTKTSAIADTVMEEVRSRNPHEPEFLQAVEEVIESVVPFLAAHPEFIRAKIPQRVVEPERIIQFRVPWVDDKGELQVNRGQRVQFNSAIGPVQGRPAFPSQTVNLSHPQVPRLRADLQEQPDDSAHRRRQGRQRLRSRKGKSDNGGHALLPELHDRAVPSHRPRHRRARGRHRRRRPRDRLPVRPVQAAANEFTGVLTGKGLNWGGSLIRPEATGYGTVYFAAEMLGRANETFDGKTCLVSGSRQRRAVHRARSCSSMGAKPITLSDSGGFIHDPDGIDREKLAWVMDLKNGRRGRIKPSTPRSTHERDLHDRWIARTSTTTPCGMSRCRRVRSRAPPRTRSTVWTRRTCVDNGV